VIQSLISFAVVTLISCVSWKLVGQILLYLLGVSVNQWKHTLAFMVLGAAIEGLFSIWVFQWLDKFDRATFKNLRAEQTMEDELQLNNEGF
jgi:H+/Cl- antiporter ClcA